MRTQLADRLRRGRARHGGTHGGRSRMGLVHGVREREMKGLSLLSSFCPFYLVLDSVYGWSYLHSGEAFPLCLVLPGKLLIDVLRGVSSR